MKTAVVQISAQGATVVVPGLPGLFVRVYAFSLSALPVDDVVPTFSLLKFQSLNALTGVATDLTGYRALNQMGLAWELAMTSMRIQRPDAYFVTNIGEGLAIYQQDAFDCGGFVCYESVPG